MGLHSSSSPSSCPPPGTSRPPRAAATGAPSPSRRRPSPPSPRSHPHLYPHSRSEAHTPEQRAACEEHERAEALGLGEDGADLVQDAFRPATHAHCQCMRGRGGGRGGEEGVSLAQGRRRRCAGPREGRVSVSATVCAALGAERRGSEGRRRTGDARDGVVMCRVFKDACRCMGVASRSAKRKKRHVSVHSRDIRKGEGDATRRTISTDIRQKC
ncbi:hypothetical protein FIBSPDRAFT_68390 [Athelia psychrophila]|uniref:Uncharacterized protein n=1 Tax=Athelia psychrophila TaxID=1759441 RepID=A0A166EQY3_9AGAM|nr:hypothetical protein FIBSPDRAFT_68390 [Fibularhizoctonia sp. CBS 109695]